MDSGEPVSLADCYQYPVIGTQMPDWSWDRVQSAVVEAGADIDNIHDIVLIAGDFGLIREVVQQSDAVSGTFVANLKAEMDTGSLVALPLMENTLDAPLPAIVATLANRVLPPAAEKVRETVKAIAADLVQAAGTDGV